MQRKRIFTISLVFEPCCSYWLPHRYAKQSDSSDIVFFSNFCVFYWLPHEYAKQRTNVTIWLYVAVFDWLPCRHAMQRARIFNTFLCSKLAVFIDFHISTQSNPTAVTSHVFFSKFVVFDRLPRKYATQRAREKRKIKRNQPGYWRHPATRKANPRLLATPSDPTTQATLASLGYSRLLAATSDPARQTQFLRSQVRTPTGPPKVGALFVEIVLLRCYYYRSCYCCYYY